MCRICYHLIENNHMANNQQGNSNNSKLAQPPPVFAGGLFGTPTTPLFPFAANNTPKSTEALSGVPASNPSLFGGISKEGGLGGGLFGTAQKTDLFSNKGEPSGQPPALGSLFGGTTSNTSSMFGQSFAPPSQSDTTKRPPESLFGANQPSSDLAGKITPAPEKKDEKKNDVKKEAEKTPLFGTSMFGNSNAPTSKGLFESFGKKLDNSGGQATISLGNASGSNQTAPVKAETQKDSPSNPLGGSQPETKQPSTGLFGSSPAPSLGLLGSGPATTSALFGNNTTTSGLFGTNAAPSLFGGISASTTPSLFGGITQNQPAASKSLSPAPTPASTTANPQPPLATSTNTSSLFGGQGAISSSSAPKATTIGQTKQENTQNGPTIPTITTTAPVLPGLSSLNKDSITQPKASADKPLEKKQIKFPDLKPMTDSKQPNKQTTTAPSASLFGASIGAASTGIGSLFSKQKQNPSPKAQAKQTEPLTTMSEPKPATESKPLDTALSSFTESRRKEPISEPMSEPQQPKMTVQSNQSDGQTITLSKEKNREQTATQETKNTVASESKEERPMFSFLKLKEPTPASILDYKTLRQEQKGEMFSTFLSQSSRRIIDSVKLHFTVRAEPFKPRENKATTEKERFLVDLTNLLTKVLGLADASWELVGQFVRRVIAEERYERVLFKEDMLVGDYFRTQLIYQAGTGGYYLNQGGSRELQFLVEKVVNRWNVERVGLLNFLMSYSDLMHRPSDLFAYLFRHLLEMDRKLIETSNQQYRLFITDFQLIAKRKLAELISYYNTRLREFKLVGAEEVKGLLKLLEGNRDESINQLALKVLLNCINFRQPKELSGEVLDQIKQSKSFVLMPLRALVHRLSSRRHEFVPSPKDLYRYIRGDEWIDWFDIYLSESGREGVELQVGEPELILEGLCSISGRLLLDRMLGTKKGVLRFFNLLRDQNLVGLYYRLLQACIFDERSIGEVDEFYFRRMHFDVEYQDVIEYVAAFNEQVHSNEQAVLPILQVKISLLAKILEVSPGRLVELQRYLFYRDYNKHKRFKGDKQEEGSRAEGEKLVHLFLDTINITSLKGLPNRILHRIFRVLTHLLQNQQTERIVLAALRMNRPSFAFMQNDLHSLTLNALNQFLEQLLSGTYLHDLILGYAEAKEEELRMEAFYPFRYHDAQLSNLLKQEQLQGTASSFFSIYWFNQALKVLPKQPFNPYLLHRLLQKLHIQPYLNESPSEQSISFYQKSKLLQGRIPTILQPVISTLNELTLWENVAKVLDFKLVRSEGRLEVANKVIMTSPTRETRRCLLYTLKVVSLAFKLTGLLEKQEERAGGHWVIRVLSAINFLSRGKISSHLASNANKNGMLLSVLAAMQVEDDPSCHSLRNIPWEAEQAEEEETAYNALVKFINNNKTLINFDLANNILTRPDDDLYRAGNSILTLGLQVLLELIRMAPECSLQHTLTSFLPLKDDEKADLRKELLRRLASSLTKTVNGPEGDRVIRFLHALKYDCGANKLHGGLSGRLFEEVVKVGQGDFGGKFSGAICTYLLREMQEGNYSHQALTEQLLQNIICGLHFRDGFLNNYHQFKDTKEMGRMVRRYLERNYSLLNLNQVERIVDERALVQLGHQFHTLTSVADILLTQLLRRKHSQSLINCLSLFNTLLLTHNLPLLHQDLPACLRLPGWEVQEEDPRAYLRDPTEAYIAGGVSLEEVQVQQKNNLVEWLVDRCQRLSDKLISYLKFILTLDKYPYANNPVSFTLDGPLLARLDLFCHLSLGRMNLAATELFGKCTSDSIDTVQGIASNLLTRLVEMRKEQGRSQEGLRMLGYCFEWLRGKEKYGENASHYLVRKLHKNYAVILPEPGALLSPDAIKVLLSALSIGDKYFSAEARSRIRQSVYCIVERYWVALQRGLEEESRSFGELFQQAAALLLLVPPEKSETRAFQMLVGVWTRERNFQFFFNESRLLVQLAKLYPEEVVKLQPLTRCEIIAPLAPHYARYLQDERRFQGIAWTWVVKIASELANHPLSILVVAEVSAFFKRYQDRFIGLFEPVEKLTRSYLEDLQGGLQLLASLFSHDLWVSFNRPLAEQLTHMLSHKLIRVFVLFAQGKLPLQTVSGNDRALAAVKAGEEESGYDSMTQDDMFVTEMRVRMMYCLRNYCLVMRLAFRASRYVEAHFEPSAPENCRYFSSFWDAFNKQLVSLLVFANKQFKLWGGVRRLDEALNTLAQCTAAPYSFVENGYLCTILQRPLSEYELFSELYLLNYLLCEVAALHLLKERLYAARFNSLMNSHIEQFAKRLREHIEGVRVDTRKLTVPINQYVAEAEFVGLLELIDSGKLTK